MKGRTAMEVRADGVALITIVNLPFNSPSFEVLQSLKENYKQALRTDDVKNIVVIGANGKFYSSTCWVRWNPADLGRRTHLLGLMESRKSVRPSPFHHPFVKFIGFSHSAFAFHSQTLALPAVSVL